MAPLNGKADRSHLLGQKSPPKAARRAAATHKPAAKREPPFRVGARQLELV